MTLELHKIPANNILENDLLLAVQSYKPSEYNIDDLPDMEQIYTPLLKNMSKADRRYTLSLKKDRRSKLKQRVVSMPTLKTLPDIPRLSLSSIESISEDELNVIKLNTINHNERLTLKTVDYNGLNRVKSVSYNGSISKPRVVSAPSIMSDKSTKLSELDFFANAFNRYEQRNSSGKNLPGRIIPISSDFNQPLENNSQLFNYPVSAPEVSYSSYDYSEEAHLNIYRHIQNDLEVPLNIHRPIQNDSEVPLNIHRPIHINTSDYSMNTFYKSLKDHGFNGSDTSMTRNDFSTRPLLKSALLKRDEVFRPTHRRTKSVTFSELDSVYLSKPDATIPGIQGNFQRACSESSSVYSIQYLYDKTQEEEEKEKDENSCLKENTQDADCIVFEEVPAASMNFPETTNQAVDVSNIESYETYKIVTNSDHAATLDIKQESPASMLNLQNSTEIEDLKEEPEMRIMEDNVEYTTTRDNSSREAKFVSEVGIKPQYETSNVLNMADHSSSKPKKLTYKEIKNAVTKNARKLTVTKNIVKMTVNSECVKASAERNAVVTDHLRKLPNLTSKNEDDTNSMTPSTKSSQSYLDYYVHQTAVQEKPLPTIDVADSVKTVLDFNHEHAIIHPQVGQEMQNLTINTFYDNDSLFSDLTIDIYSKSLVEVANSNIYTSTGCLNSADTQLIPKELAEFYSLGRDDLLVDADITDEESDTSIPELKPLGPGDLNLQLRVSKARCKSKASISISDSSHDSFKTCETRGSSMLNLEEVATLLLHLDKHIPYNGETQISNYHSSEKAASFEEAKHDQYIYGTEVPISVPETSDKAKIPMMSLLHKRPTNVGADLDDDSTQNIYDWFKNKEVWGSQDHVYFEESTHAKTIAEHPQPLRPQPFNQKAIDNSLKTPPKNHVSLERDTQPFESTHYTDNCQTNTISQPDHNLEISDQHMNQNMEREYWERYHKNYMISMLEYYQSQFPMRFATEKPQDNQQNQETNYRQNSGNCDQNSNEDSCPKNNQDSILAQKRKSVRFDELKPEVLPKDEKFKHSRRKSLSDLKVIRAAIPLIDYFRREKIANPTSKSANKRKSQIKQKRHHSAEYQSLYKTTQTDKKNLRSVSAGYINNFQRVQPTQIHIKESELPPKPFDIPDSDNSNQPQLNEFEIEEGFNPFPCTEPEFEASIGKSSYHKFPFLSINH